MNIDLEKTIAAINRIYLVSQIPITIINDKLEDIYFVPGAFHHFLPPVLYLNHINIYKNSNLPNYYPLILIRETDVLIGIIKLPDNHYLIAGPVSSRKHSLEELTKAYSEILSRHEIMNIYKVNQQSSLMDVLGIANVLSLLILSIYKVDIQPVDIIKTNDLHHIPVPPTAEKNEFNLTEEQTVEYNNLVMILNRLIDGIISGNTFEVEDTMQAPLKISQNMLNTFSNAPRHHVISFLTMCAYAALRGGAIPEKVFKLYNTNIAFMENTTNIQSTYPYFFNEALNYCNLVKSANGKSLMPDVCKECEHYINDHITEKITISDLTKACGVSKKTLYSTFEPYFGMTVNEYIQSEKIKRAKILLSSSNYTISEVSNSLGFSSQSYFTVIFEKYCKCTPKEYTRGKAHSI